MSHRFETCLVRSPFATQYSEACIYTGLHTCYISLLLLLIGECDLSGMMLCFLCCVCVWAELVFALLFNNCVIVSVVTSGSFITAIVNTVISGSVSLFTLSLIYICLR